LTPSPARLLADLTPASGRQNDTTSPSASAPFVTRAARVHRIPPRVDDVAQRPSVGRDGRGYIADLGPLAREISEIQKLITSRESGARFLMCRSFLGRRTSQLNVSCLSWKSPAKLPAVVSQDRRLPALAKAGSERVEDAALAVFCKTPIASDCLTEFRNVLNTLQFIGEWCNGSTTDSDSVCLGSNPSSPAS
jgi:hypothetical protein